MKNLYLISAGLVDGPANAAILTESDHASKHELLPFENVICQIPVSKHDIHLIIAMAGQADARTSSAVSRVPVLSTSLHSTAPTAFRKNIDSLITFINSDKNVKALRLSLSNIKLDELAPLLLALSKNTTIQYLTLDISMTVTLEQVNAKLAEHGLALAKSSTKSSGSLAAASVSTASFSASSSALVSESSLAGEFCLMRKTEITETPIFKEYGMDDMSLVAPWQSEQQRLHTLDESENKQKRKAGSESLLKPGILVNIDDDGKHSYGLSNTHYILCALTALSAVMIPILHTWEANNPFAGTPADILFLASAATGLVAWVAQGFMDTYAKHHKTSPHRGAVFFDGLLMVGAAGLFAAAVWTLLAGDAFNSNIDMANGSKQTKDMFTSLYASMGCFAAATVAHDAIVAYNRPAGSR